MTGSNITFPFTLPMYAMLQWCIRALVIAKVDILLGFLLWYTLPDLQDGEFALLIGILCLLMYCSYLSLSP